MSETATDAPITVTIKGGKGYEVPWIVVRGESTDEVKDILSDIADSDLYQLAADAAALFQGAVTVTSTPAGSDAPTLNPGPTTPARQDTPAPAQGGSSYARRKASATTGGRGGQPDNSVSPGVTPEACHHGDRVYRSGAGAKGPWQAWMCPSPKGTPGQCEPLWVRD